VRFLPYIAFFVLVLPAEAQDTAADFRAAVSDAAILALSTRAPDRADNVTVTVIRLPQEIVESSSSLEVVLPALPVVPRGRIQVGLRTDNQARGHAMIQIAHFDSVAVPVAALAGGAPVSSGDLRFVWMETTRHAGDPLTPSALRALGNQELIARRSLRADRPLRATDLERRPAADTGDPVRMKYRRGAFMLELSCHARDRGQIGDVIRLYAEDSDTTYRARLTAPGRAEWIETL
jgi:flagella basal body P-ring formation protein FlgA